MNGKLIFASILAASSAAAFGQTAHRTAIDKATPLLYGCTVTPATLDHAIKTKGTGTSGRTAADATAKPWSRVDLEFAITAPSAGQTVPTVSGHAIKNKGTGASGRMLSSRPVADVTIPISCTSGKAASGEGVTKTHTTIGATFGGLTRVSAPDPAFSCTVTGTLENPQFTVGIWTGITGSEPAGASDERRKPRKGESLSHWLENGGNMRVAIVRTDMDSDGDFVSPSSRVTCSSETAAMRGSWDLAVLKKP